MDYETEGCRGLATGSVTVTGFDGPLRSRPRRACQAKVGWWIKSKPSGRCFCSFLLEKHKIETKSNVGFEVSVSNRKK